MKVHGYSSAELQLFYRVLDRMVTEIAERPATPGLRYDSALVRGC